MHLKMPSAKWRSFCPGWGWGGVVGCVCVGVCVWVCVWGGVGVGVGGELTEPVLALVTDTYVRHKASMSSK